MTVINPQQVFDDIRTGKRSFDSQTPQEIIAVKSYLASQKPISSEAPLASTVQGQKKLKKQAQETIALEQQSKAYQQKLPDLIQNMPRPANVMPSPSSFQDVTPPTKTWGEQLAESYPKTAQTIAGASELLGKTVKMPFGISPFSAMGASSSIVGDIAQNLTKPTGAEFKFNAPSQFAQGVSEYYKDKPWYASPAEAINAGFEGINKASEFAPIQTVKNVYARNEMRKGATAEQAMAKAEDWVKQNPNLTGTIANVGSAVLDPLNLVGGGAVAKLGRGVEKATAKEVPTLAKQLPQMPTKKLTYVGAKQPIVSQIAEDLKPKVEPVAEVKLAQTTPSLSIEDYTNVKNKHAEIDTEVKNIQNQIDELQATHKKDYQDMANKFWDNFVKQGKKMPKTTLDEAVKSYGYIKTPVEGDYFYSAYKTIPDIIKRKYFRKDAKYTVDSFSNDALGQSANDFMDQLNSGQFPIMPEDQWIKDFMDEYGHAPTKQKLVEFFKNQADRQGVNDSHNENIQALQSVQDELKKSKSELPAIPAELPAKKQPKQPKLAEQIAQDLKPKVKSVAKTEAKESQQKPLVERVKEAQSRIEERNKQSDERNKQRLGIVAGQPLASVPIGAGASQAVNDVVRAGKLRQAGLISTTVDSAKEAVKKIGETWDSIKTEFKPLGKIKDDNTTRELLFNGQSELSSVPNKVEMDIRKILHPIKDVRDMPLFSRLVLFKDLVETKLRDPNAKLPRDLSLTDAQDELNRLENMAKGNSNVLAALANYYDHMKAVADDLVARGLLKAEDIRQNYFPHAVLDYADKFSDDGEFVASGGLDTAYRGYTKKRGGSEKDLNTDFVDVIRNSLAKTYADNIKSDVLKGVIDRTDALPTLNAFDVEKILQRKNVREAQKALPATMPKDEFMQMKIQELLNKGMSPSKAKATAKFAYINQGIVGYKRKMADFLRKENVSEDSINAIVDVLWKDSRENPQFLFKALKDEPVMVGDKPYRFFQPRYTNKLQLIPEGVYQEVKQFGAPLFSNQFMRFIYQGHKGFKTVVLTLSTPARVLVDSISNMEKLLRYDPKAVTYLPKAFRISLMNADNSLLKNLSERITKITQGKYTAEDQKLLDLLKKYHVVEPSVKIKGNFEFVPMFNQFLKTIARPDIMSQNITRKSDELYRIMKASADYERMVNGKPVKLTILDRFLEPTSIVDVQGLDKEFALSKTAKEFFVDSARQSRLTRKLQLLVPFLNWAGVDTLHNLRFIRTNPKKALAGMAGLVAGFEAWNNTGDRRQQEEQLSEAKRQIPHLNTGYTDEQGNPYIIYFPIFSGMTAASALGLPTAVNAITDVVVGRKSASQAVEETPLEMLKYGKRTTLGMLGPAKSLIEAITNRSLYTMSDIVPANKYGTPEGNKKMIAYIASAFFPPMRNYSSAGKQLEALQEGEKGWAETIGKALDNIFIQRPTERFIKKEELASLGKEKSYDIQQKAQLAKNKAYENLDNEFVNYFLTGNQDGIVRVAQQNMLSSKEVRSHIVATLPRIVAKALSQTSDPAKVAELRDMLNALNGKDAVGRYKASAKYNEEDARRALDMQLGGQ